MPDEWFTLERAAKHLGMSTRTIRRWIHAGKLQAELRPGPYGQQYLIPLPALHAVHLVRDVERAERSQERERVPQVVEAYLARRDDELRRLLEHHLAELHAALRGLQQQNEELRAELAAIRQELATMRPDQATGA